jgi:hypothetical protein
MTLRDSTIARQDAAAEEFKNPEFKEVRRRFALARPPFS